MLTPGSRLPLSSRLISGRFDPAAFAPQLQERFGADVETLRQRAGSSLYALAERSQLDHDDLTAILEGESKASIGTTYPSRRSPPASTPPTSTAA
jgi:hypothetical protein